MKAEKKSLKFELSLAEEERLQILRQYEEELWQNAYQYIAGVDEVGRGCIAGPVVAAAVVLPRDFMVADIDDSKKLSPVKRTALAKIIKERALDWSIASVSTSLLDEMNIYNASKEAMRRAIRKLKINIDYLLIDAMHISDINIKQQAIIKGDTLSVSIASASIIAKVERDRMMEDFDHFYPGYDFSKHKGYATKRHLEALQSKGICPIHRKSFEPVKSMLLGGKYGQQLHLFE